METKSFPPPNFPNPTPTQPKLLVILLLPSSSQSSHISCLILILIPPFPPRIAIYLMYALSRNINYRDCVCSLKEIITEAAFLFICCVFFKAWGGEGV